MPFDPASDISHGAGAPQRVLVIGGGLGGMAAAFSLARALGPGKVCLVEARPETGGRLRSFFDSKQGEIVDNCQHLMMGCCANLRRFTDEAGLEKAWVRQKYLTFATPDGNKSRFQADPLPSPFHLARAFWRLHTLPMSGKVRLARAMLALASWRDQGTDERVDTWLESMGQSATDKTAFWEPLLVSALNDGLPRLGMRAAKQVVAEAFLGGKNAFDLWLPARPLGELFGQNLREKLAQAGVTILTDLPVRNLVFQDGKPRGALCRNGQILQADAVILAAPHKASWEILQASNLNWDGPAWSDSLGSSSITAIHLWFDRRVMREEHAALVGCLGHWVFRKAWASEEDSYCQVVISASDHLLEEPSESLIQKAATETLSIFWARDKAQPKPSLVHGRVVREKSATFRQAPDLDHLRPKARCPWPGLVLAGDHTHTHWPSTMEGAVRSGLAAARKTLDQLGCAQSEGLLEVTEAPRSWFQRLICRDLP